MPTCKMLVNRTFTVYSFKREIITLLLTSFLPILCFMPHLCLQVQFNCGVFSASFNLPIFQLAQIQELFSGFSSAYFQHSLQLNLHGVHPPLLLWRRLSLPYFSSVLAPSIVFSESQTKINVGNLFSPLLSLATGSFQELFSTSELFSYYPNLLFRIY